jgi:hypothetical protein
MSFFIYIYKKTQNMTFEEKKWFLSLPEDLKLKLMGDMLKEGQFGLAFQTMKILLDAPLSEGGISTEKINEVFEGYHDKI